MTARDDYFRCPVCKQLFKDEDCELDPDKGYQCPNKCIKPFEQPPYNSPLNSDYEEQAN